MIGTFCFYLSREVLVMYDFCQKTEKMNSTRYTCACGKKAVFFQKTTGKYVGNIEHEYCQKCWKSKVSQHRSWLLQVGETSQSRWQSKRHMRRMYESICLNEGLAMGAANDDIEM
jgi:hypothetical protein